MKIICIGRNYSDHAKELNNPVPECPVIFLKPDTALIPGKQPFFLPDFSNDVHYELEVVIRISRLGKNIQEKFASKYYSQVTLGVDFTARDLQKELKAKGLPWERAKAFDHSAPIGEFVQINSDLNFDNGFEFTLLVNGEQKQIGNTKDMIFGPHRLINEISEIFTLKIGDLIFTGTPQGVGKVNKGDHLEGFIEKQKVFDLKVR